MSVDNTPIDELNSIFEERADFLEEDELQECTVTGSEFFKKIYNALISRGTKLIIGPRGCGKTHIMRYAWLECKKEKAKPLAIYVSFNKYFRLEPLLKSKPNAISLFHTWTLAKILYASHEISSELKKNEECQSKLNQILLSDKDALEALINRLEQNLSPTTEQEELVEKLSVSGITHTLHNLSEYLERKKIVVFLDDAALTLTPEYLYEFFDMVRALKTPKISLKASVYPGTTEYGSKFSVAHEAELIDAWLSVEAGNYSSIMGSIAERRFNDYKNIPPDISELLKYAAFGVPRSYLMMLREYQKNDLKGGQQKFKKIIEKYANVRLSEYRSLINKLPKFENLIKTGEFLLKEIIISIKKSNKLLNNKNEKQIIIGIEKEDNPLFNRMINLLVEVGLLSQLPPVSHGEDRSYERYIPHYALLIKERAFSQSSRGFSSQRENDYIKRKNSKHPVRRNQKTLLGDEMFSKLQLALPPCKQCKTLRLTDNQKFCHNCGSHLIDESTFTKCMSLKISELPLLTTWQSQKIKQLENLKTVGDILAIQDPGTELRKLDRIGHKRADKMIRNITLYVEEYLS